MVILMLLVIPIMLMIVTTTTTTNKANAVISKCPGTQSHPYEQCLANDGRETLKAIIRGLFE
jgi:hypothetical protein